ncbi:MAG: hypothetical protein KF887_06005 [Paracoccaceae bacterium]|nr:MAG: hypothetical protein KF887_06005 [Paracoccaceae bacterium]
MHYMILNYTSPSEYADADAVAAAAAGEVWSAYTRALIEAGVFVGGNALHPSHTATTLRVRGEVRDVQDGPYAASKEQFGGYYIIDVPDLDTALNWAALNPAATSGAVEVRPVVMRGAA